MKNKIFILIFIVIIFGIIIEEIIRKNNIETVVMDKKDSEQEYIQPRKQNNYKRIYQDIIITQETAIYESSKEYILYKPIMLKLDSENNIIIADAGDKKIKIFTPEGIFMNSYGRGKGEGPGEFLSFTDMSINHNGELFILDQGKSTLSVFNQNGSIKYELKVHSIPECISSFENGNCIVKISSSGNDGMFNLYDNSGMLISSFGLLIPGQKKYFMLTVGVMAQDRKNIYYAFQTSGALCSFDQYGKLNYFVETIDGFVLPKIKINKNDNITGESVDDQALIRSTSIMKEGESLYINDDHTSLNKKAIIFDKYNAADGTYICSFILPYSIVKDKYYNFVYMNSHKIYVCGTNIYVFSYKYCNASLEKEILNH